NGDFIMTFDIDDRICELAYEDGQEAFEDGQDKMPASNWMPGTVYYDSFFDGWNGAYNESVGLE
ncbi:MAG: hypothetical protein ABJ298_02145, partial [Parasphingorhabdus sp.]